MSNKKIEKAVDYFINHIDDVDSFTFKKIFLYYSLTLKREKDKLEFKEIENDVITRLKYYNYIEQKYINQWKLTEEGKTARTVGGHFVYQNKIKKKMSKFEIWTLIISLGALLIAGFTLYKDYINTDIDKLVKRIEVLEKSIK